MMSLNNNHWVCVRGFNRQLELYDSYERSSLDEVLAKNIKNTINFQNYESPLKINVKSVQIQKTACCGFFAVAFAAALCEGLDPQLLLFDETEIKKHFIDILYGRKEYEMFPFKMNKKKYRKSLTLNF
jgi:hypothetical protein